MADVHDRERAEAGSGASVPPRAARAGPVGLVRERLTSRLLDTASYRVGWVVAPAGSGKSRLLAHVRDRYAGPVAWCDTPDPVPRNEAALVAWLWDALEEAGVDGTDGAAPTGLESVLSLGGPTGQPLLIVMDDVHLLEGSEAETALGRLVARLPASWRLILASRMNLSIDLSRLRVSGEVIDIGPDELRFRTWEVEELFRDVYGEPLLPEDVAALTRRTDGWAAYLQMFFLATSRRPLAERRLVLGTLQHRTRLVSEYLARHVLAGLDPALQDFLIRTSVLRRPSGHLSDEFLGWDHGSADLLAELERRRLFTERLADDSYRYHAVLLSYLDAKLVETVGLDAAKREHRRAAQLLEREGCLEEALAAYARSEDWDGLARVLQELGAAPGALDDAWVEVLPPSVVEADPLLLMAQARGATSRGALDEASRILRRAEAVAASAAVAGRCRAERERVLEWSEPDRAPQSDWIGVIRRATQRQPAEAKRMAERLPGVNGRFAEAAAALLAGDVASCHRILRSVAGHPDAQPVVLVGGVFLSIVCGRILGQPVSAEHVDRLREEVEASGVRWLNRVVRAGLQVDGPGSAQAIDDLVAACERLGDRWGAALIAAMAGLRRLALSEPEEAEGGLTEAAEMFARLGAGVVEAWVIGYAGVAARRAGRPEMADRHAARARALGSALDVPAAAALGSLVRQTEGRAGDAGNARQIMEQHGTWTWTERMLGPAGPDARPTAPAVVANHGPEDVPPVRIRCLGRFELEIAGRRFDQAAAKPMERALLHLLSLRAGSPSHRETLVASLWPDADRDAGLHRLQVAVSSLRRLISATGADGNDVLVRSGDSYSLALPEGSKVDITQFQDAVQRAESARARGNSEEERRALDEAMAHYGGPLLPGDGPAEWVVEPRRWLVGLYADAAARTAALTLDDDPRQAVRAARAGLAADRYRDDLWKLLIEGAERAGNQAEAEKARREYEAVLNDLGV